MKRVVHYPRVSSVKQAEEGDSIEFQENRLKQHSEDKADKCVGVYTDAGKSASLSEDNMDINYSKGKLYIIIDVSKRPGMMRILEELKQDIWDAIKITKWDRFSRNNIFSKIVQIYFNKNKKDIIPVDDSIDPLLMDIKGALSEEEVRKLKERVRNTRSLRFNRGDIISKAPIGYTYDKRTKKMNVDNKKADLVKKVFQMASEGYSYKQICSVCGLKPQSYYNMIRNKIYKGIVTFEGQERPTNFEPLISKEIWDKANGL